MTDSDESKTIFEQLPDDLQTAMNAFTDQAKAQSFDDFDIMFSMTLSTLHQLMDGERHTASITAINTVKTLKSFGEERVGHLVGLLLNALAHEVLARMGPTMEHVSAKARAGWPMFAPDGPLAGKTFGVEEEE